MKDYFEPFDSFTLYQISAPNGTSESICKAPTGYAVVGFQVSFLCLSHHKDSHIEIPHWRLSDTSKQVPADSLFSLALWFFTLMSQEEKPASSCTHEGQFTTTGICFLGCDFFKTRIPVRAVGEQQMAFMCLHLKRVPVSDAWSAFTLPVLSNTLNHFAAVVTEELKCPISRTGRGKHVDLNKDTCMLCALHAEAVGFHHKRNTL